MTKIAVFSCVFSLVVAGCGSDAKDNIDDEGCEHLQMGPPTAVTATETALATSPEVKVDHTRYDVTLATSGTMKGGFVRFASAQARDWVFFLGKDVPFAVQDGAGAPVALTSSTASSSQCTEIKGKHVVALGVGTYHLKLGPTAETAVGVVAEENP